MHIYHAGSPFCHILTFSVKRRTRSGVRRPRCQHSILVTRQAHLYARHYQSSADARRGRVQCRVESRRQIRGKRRRRRRRQGLCPVSRALGCAKPTIRGPQSVCMTLAARIHARPEQDVKAQPACKPPGGLHDRIACMGSAYLSQ